MTIALVAGTGIAATRAYFSDTETSTGNVLSAGTIDISVGDGVNQQNPWNQILLTSQMGDLKPGMQKTVTFTVGNEGQNPLVLWKRVNVTLRAGGDHPESEEASDPGDAINNLDSKIHYDMTVGAVNTIPVAWNVMMSDIDQLWIPLGTVEAGASLSVTQVYKLDEQTGNEYQGDQLTFDIVLYAEQVGAPGPSHTTRGVVLENKDAAFNSIMDNTWGLLTFDLATGNYRLRAWNLTGIHQLQAWNSVTNTSIAKFGPVYAGANLDDVETYLGFTTNVAAKYWLWDTSWINANTLWESNLVN